MNRTGTILLAVVICLGGIGLGPSAANHSATTTTTTTTTTTASIGNESDVRTGLVNDSVHYRGKVLVNNTWANPGARYELRDRDTGDLYENVSANATGVLIINTTSLPTDTDIAVVNASGGVEAVFTLRELGLRIKLGDTIVTNGGTDQFYAGSNTTFRAIYADMRQANRDVILSSPDVNLSAISQGGTGLSDGRVLVNSGGDGEATLYVNLTKVSPGTIEIIASDRDTLITANRSLDPTQYRPYHYVVLSTPTVTLRENESYWAESKGVYNTTQPNTTVEVYQGDRFYATRATNSSGIVEFNLAYDTAGTYHVKWDADGDGALETRLNFTVLNQTLGFTAADTTLDLAGTTTTNLTVSSNRSGHDVILYSPDLNRSQLLAVVPAAETTDGHVYLRNLSPNTTIQADFSTLPSGTYTLDVTVPVTRKRANVTIELQDSSTPTPTPSPTATTTPTPTSTPSPIPTRTPTPVPTATPTPTASPTSTASPSPPPTTASATDSQTETDQPSPDSPTTEPPTPTASPSPVTDSTTSTGTFSATTDSPVGTTTPGFDLLVTLAVFAVGLVTLLRVRSAG